MNVTIDGEKTKRQERSMVLSLVPLTIAALKISIFKQMQNIYSNIVQPIFSSAFDNRITPLEAAYLTATLVILIFLSILFAVIRYRQVDSTYKRFDFNLEPNYKTKILRWNKLGFVSILFMTLAELIFAITWNSDQVSTRIACGVIYFVAGYLSAIIQTKLSFLTVPHLTTRRLAVARFILLIAILVFSVASQELATVLFFWLPPDYQSQTLADRKLRWTAQHNNYYLYIFFYCMKALLWLVANAFIASFYYDFKRCKLVDGDIRFERYE